ncbi:galactose oxidase early set domain-containing protein [Actinoplanes solisilvae]|uniref:galactose oxidase early set domain-containing protein n=1 Tax=Actinoplanes solisilvae TaxID=2486853 RepID=UPI000FD9CD2F|nr:galactose oxidase early set domain-containing protein [Actinoplanes solisilvae]
MKPRPRPSLARRMASGTVAVVVLAVVAFANRPVLAAGSEALHNYNINRQSYKEKYGHWARLPVPAGFRVNAIHAALLSTGKVLIVAGSGNDREQFEAGTFRTVLYDPRTEKFSRVPTPTDVFCAGHSFLANGNLLVAGGTKSYEVLEKDVKRAGGVMKVKNESPDGGPRTFAKGTKFRSAAGHEYASRTAFTVPAAGKVVHGPHVAVTAGETEVWVDAVRPGDAPIVREGAQYRLDGVTDGNLYGVADKITREKQEYGGDKTSYEFDPRTERYHRTGDLTEHRWYPTLVTMGGGDVLAVSGLDEFGRIIEGRNEVYHHRKRAWSRAPQLQRYFPTYPSLHLMADGRVFYSGANSGYGSDAKGRTPGVWNLTNNDFQPVGGLRQPELNETATSLMLPPVQNQQVMILGGGGVGDSPISTARTDIVDLRQRKPVYRPGPDLPKPARYLSTVVLPDDTVLTSGGSSGYRGGPYRGQGRSDLLNAQFYVPSTNSFRTAAASTIGRNYHSEAILLPDGRVVTMGSDPLYDRTGEAPGSFEKRIEVYSPPYLFRGKRPVIAKAPGDVSRGDTFPVGTPDAARIASARLIRPSSVTHGTDTDQRSVALGLKRAGGRLELRVPNQAGIAPSGWYMLFLVDDQGRPSVARWVRVR